MPMNELRLSARENPLHAATEHPLRIMERTPIEPSSASFADNLTAQEPMDASPDPFRVGSMQAPQDLLADGRRAFLGAATFLALVACAPKQDVPILTSSSRRPDAIWDSGPSVAATAAPAPPIKSDQAATPTVSPKPTSSGPAALGWAKPRALWAQAAPEISLMNPMLPVTSVTVHHDGLDKLETGTSTAEMADRIDLYRVGHRAKGWGDIGYHLIIDRAGTLWQGRSIRFQGAHVKNRNEGNIGVLVMGNFQVQQPTKAQLATLSRVLTDLRGQYRVSKSRIYSHREWKGAATSCPGDKLQVAFAKMRMSQRA